MSSANWSAWPRRTIGWTTLQFHHYTTEHSGASMHANAMGVCVQIFFSGATEWWSVAINTTNDGAPRVPLVDFGVDSEQAEASCATPQSGWRIFVKVAADRRVVIEAKSAKNALHGGRRCCTQAWLSPQAEDTSILRRIHDHVRSSIESLPTHLDVHA